jgi:hypothetical protein
VHLEVKDSGEQRAVKSIRKSLASQHGIGYKRELTGLTVFSRSKVRLLSDFLAVSSI